MKTIAVIIHRETVGRTADLATHLDMSAHLDQVTVVANDLSERPAGLPAGVSWLVPPRDLGRGGAFRHAVAAMPAAAAYLLVENNVRIDDATIGACLELLAGANIGVVAPTLVDEAGARSLPARPTRYLVLPRILGNAPTDRPSEANWVSGAVMFVKAECHQRVAMDGRYFRGLEDIDFCYRVRDAGWSVVVCPRTAWRSGADPDPGVLRGYYEVRNRLWLTRVRGWRGRTAAAALWTLTVSLPHAIACSRRSEDHRPGHTEGQRPDREQAGREQAGRRQHPAGRLVLRGLLDGLGPLPPSGDPRPDEPRTAWWTAPGPRSVAGRRG
ncbi:glycosyl transferase [Parafrankia colletiae]|uniref:Glycosyl transferase n=1 Tax=Parafrankia colletiae TaxID=573497 RepID=A0A1S1RJP7_9ACTN|nr:glycosyltransferase [Parafrankia colletiae]MCK9899868.1 glycosyltransferase family 2 protein [Frankia sp. Cpl3]OHV46267.1 glycosyl transferase [Parafrankia colletiae]